jgi:hypothetical protein
MPQIPLYNKGLGATGVTTGGSLGPRASAGAFTGVGQELAKFGEVAGNMMYEYYDADKKAEAKSSIAAAENELNEKLEIYNDTDKTTNAETYDTQYKANSTKYINEVSSKYNLRPNEQKLLVARLADLSAGKHQEGRRKVSAKQDAIRGNNQGTALDRNINAMVTNAVGTPLHEKARKDAINGIVEAGAGNTLRYLSVKNLDELNLVVEEKTFTTRTNGATTTEDISKIREDLKVSNLTPEKIATQEGRLKTKETAVINNTIADIVTTATVQQDFDGVEPDTVISEEERLVVIDKYLKGDYSSNPSAKEKYESLSVKDQARVNTALVTLRNNEQAQMKWEKYQKDNKETQQIENTLNESLPKVINGEMSAKEIYGLDLPGSAGLKAKNSLLAVSQNFVNNKLPTKTDLTTYALIEDQIQNGKITSPLTPFKVGEETKALSLIERLSSETGYISTDNYNVLTGDIASVKTSEGARNLAEFKTFIDGNAGTILGPTKLNVYNTKGKQRLYSWKVNMKANFDKGIKDGKSAADLINPNSPNYIFTNEDFYIPTPMQIMQEQKDSLGTAMGVKQNFKPEQISPPIFNLPSKSVTFYDDREDKSITLGEQKYKSKKDFKLNSPEFKNWAKTYGTIWRKQPHPELGFPNGFSLRAYEMWLKSE